MLSYLLLLGLPLCMAYIHESGYQCPDTWNFDTKAKTCVKPFHSRKNWNDAKKYCQGEGGHLAMVKSQHMTNTIRVMLRRRNHYWIGISDADNDGIYNYLDGSIVSHYRRWGRGEPSNHGGNEKCVEMIGNRKGYWNDKRCNKKRAFVCELKAQYMLQCPVDWAMMKEEKLCFLAFEQKMSWHQARETCQNSGGDLAKVYKKEVSQLIRNQLSKRTRYWIGAWDEDADDTFKYVDGEPLGRFQRWARKEPNNHGGNERCIEVIGNRRLSWNDKRCGKRRKFVCQRPADVASGTLGIVHGNGDGSKPANLNGIPQ